MIRPLYISLRGLWLLILALVSLLILSEMSPIYSFKESGQFEGDFIYDPYASYNAEYGWKRTNIHTHTHASNWINECEYYPDSVLDFYRQYGYDYVFFSNHMELTTYPADSQCDIPLYEHGYNFAKLHNLSFNPKRINYYDILIPFMTSQIQFKMDVLRKGCDFIFLNHPDRTNFIGDEQMQKLSGYRLLESDCGFDEDDTYGHKWDVALSSGHYVLSAISDDLHKPTRSERIARRCCFINSQSASYDDITEALLKGNFYSVHLPDYGDGDFAVKTAANHNIPSVVSIGAHLDTLCLELDSRAAVIQAIGQDGVVVDTVMNASYMSYVMKSSDSYVRFVARYPQGEVIFLNPFARWDGDSSFGTPYTEIEHPINIFLTVLYNLLIVGLLVLIWGLSFRVLHARKVKRADL